MSKEDINLPVNIGDTVMMGRFKNKPVVVKSISWNDKGDLLINGRSAMRMRIVPQEPKEQLLTKEWWSDTFKELITEVKANTHLTHLEELVLTQGEEGYKRARSFIVELVKNLKEIKDNLEESENFKKLGEEVILNLLMRVFQRSDEGALKRASEEKGLLLVHMHPKRMQKELPFIKSEWIRDGDTQQFLKYLGNLSKEVWTASFVKYKGIEFTSISKNEEI